jgi:hypothetical protein
MDLEKVRRDLADLHSRLKQARAQMYRRANPDSWSELDSAITLLEAIWAEVEGEAGGGLPNGV